MPILYTRLINSILDCADDGMEFATADDAARQGLHAALDIAKELLAAGERVPQIEVVVSDEDGVVQRRLVTVSVAALDPGEPGFSATD